MNSGLISSYEVTFITGSSSKKPKKSFAISNVKHTFGSLIAILIFGLNGSPNIS